MSITIRTDDGIVHATRFFVRPAREPVVASEPRDNYFQAATMMNPTKQTKLEDQAAMIEARLRFDNLSRGDQVHERLIQLQSFVRHLENTKQGQADLQQRSALLGPCEQSEDESAAAFYGRLRRWLDKDLTKHVHLTRCRASAS